MPTRRGCMARIVGSSSVIICVLEQSAGYFRSGQLGASSVQGAHERAQAGWRDGGGRRSLQDFAGQRFDDAGHLAGCFEVGSVVAADQDRRLGVRYYGGEGLKAFAEVSRAALGAE